ncbi:MAG: hypothetical protein ACYSWT_13405 [Planctomycetota bacterium]
MERAEAAVQEAETKLANTKRWKRLLEREAILYKGECQRLARALEAECPQALSRLDKMIDALERYVKLPAPTIDPEAGVRAAAEQDEASEQGQATVGGDA